MKHLKIRNAGPGSLQITIPYTFARKLKLEPGDSCFWYEEDNEARLKFNKLEDLSKTSDVMNRLRVALAEPEEEPAPQDAA